MEIIIKRNWKIAESVFNKGQIMTLDETKTLSVYIGNGHAEDYEIQEIDEIFYFKLDKNIIESVIESATFTNWLNEKTAPLVDGSNPVNRTNSIPKNRETAIMYLMDLGLSSDRICNLIY